MASTLRKSAIQLLKRRKFSSTPSAAAAQTNPKNEDKILKSAFKDITPMNCTVNDFIWMNLDRWPDKTATICAVTGHGYTYAQTHRMSISFAASLRSKLKLKERSTVAIILPNVPEYPCVLLGALQAGCIGSMINPIYTADELKHQLNLIDCKAIVSSKLSYNNIKAALQALKKDIPIILIDNENLPENVIKFAELAEDLSIDTNCLKSVDIRPDDVALLPFSSGTTGLPKAVVLSHRSVVAYNQMIADPEIVAIGETTAHYQAVMPAILPFFHVFGFNTLMMNQMHLGCKLVTLPYFKPELFLKAVAEFKANALFIVPPMAVFLGKHPAVKPEHLQSLDAIVCGAAPLSEDDAKAVIAKNPRISFRQGYGLTETNGGISVGKNSDKNYAAVGHVFPSCEIQIRDIKTGEPLGAGEEGEILTRGPYLMSGYYQNEAATKEVMDNGWLKTGDIGKYDNDQYLYVTDRLKELIKVKGFQVPPAELENVVRTHPKVLDCAVVGIPDPISGEVPKAFIVTQPGQQVNPQEFLEYVNSKVAAFKKLKDVQIVQDIPKNPSGKILRKKLKEMYC